MCIRDRQEPDEVAKIRSSYRFVDIVFGTHNIFKLAELLYQAFTKKEQVIDVWEGTDQIVEDLPAVRKYSFKDVYKRQLSMYEFDAIISDNRQRDQRQDRSHSS